LCEAGEADSAVLSELERTLALLAFEQPDQCPFSDLLQPAHRQKVILLFDLQNLLLSGLFLQVASELNAAILRMEDQEATSPRLADLLRLIMWAQEELDRKKVKYPKMVDLAEATIDKVDMSK
jgi:glucose-induced degradation protein 8